MGKQYTGSSLGEVGEVLPEFFGVECFSDEDECG